MVNIQKYKENTIQYLDSTLKSVWLESENLDDKNKGYETKIYNENDQKEIDFIRTQVFENILEKIGKENPEREKLVGEYLKIICEEVFDSVFEITEGHEVFSVNIKKLTKFMKKDDEFRKFFLERYFKNLNSVFEIDKWKVIKEICKEFTKVSLEIILEVYNRKEKDKKHESYLDLLKGANKDYEEKIELATNNEEMKKIFQDILSDGILLGKLKVVAIQTGEEVVKVIKEEEESGIGKLEEKIKRIADNRREEIKKKLELVVRDYQKEVTKKNSIVDVIVLANEKAVSLSVELTKEIMTAIYNANGVTNTHLKYVKHLGSKGDKDTSTFLKNWISCGEKCHDCYELSGNKLWINCSLWEEHFRNHTNLFLESALNTIMLLKTVDEIDENKDKVLKDAKKKIVKEIKERNLTVDNLEELLEKMAIIEQVDNFKKWKIDNSEKELDLSSQTEEMGKGKQLNELQELQRKIDAYKEKLEKIWGNDKEYKEFEVQVEIPPKK